MSESSLHSSLKNFYAKNGGLQEVSIDGYMIDVIKDDTLFEIQTKHFSSLKSKLSIVLEDYKVKIIYPISKKLWIIVLPKKGDKPIRKRKSPKRGRLESLFNELIFIPGYLSHPNLSIEVIFTVEEELRRDDGKGSWRRKGVSIIDRRLITIEGVKELKFPADYQELVPYLSTNEFSNRELAIKLGIPVKLARKMTYCLRTAGILRNCGKRGNNLLYKKC